MPHFNMTNIDARYKRIITINQKKWDVHCYECPILIFYKSPFTSLFENKRTAT